MTWSLAIEEQFYLVIPWLVRWLRPRNLVVLFALGLVTAPVWREFLPSLGGYLLPFARADAICLGGLIAVAYRDEKLWPKISSLGNQLIGGLGLVSAAMIFLIAKNAGIGDVYLHTILALFGGIIILLVLIDEDHLINRLLRLDGLRWFGLRSYGIFLFHLPILGLLRQISGRAQAPELAGWTDVGVMLAALGATLLLSEISYRFFESKMIVLGRRLT